MFSRTFQPVFSSANARLSHAARVTHQRRHSATSTHSSFPATLVRINAGAAFKQFPFERHAQSDQLSRHDSFGESKGNHGNANDWTTCLYLDKSTLMPNTFKMQEIIRSAAENYLEDVDNGLYFEGPFIFTIPKGTVLPTTLVLLRDDMAEVSLQPSLSTSPTDLKNILNEFYSTYADKREVMAWLDDHKYENAIPSESEKQWVAL